MRMAPSRFEHLFTLVGHRIEKRIARIRKNSTKTRSHAPLSSYRGIPTIIESQLSYWEINRLSNCFGNSPGHIQFSERFIYENTFYQKKNGLTYHQLGSKTHGIFLIVLAQ